MNQTLWTATAAFVIGGAVRAIKADAFPLSVPKRALPWLALFLGFLAAALDARMNGVDWETAAASGITATALAVFGHDVLRGVPGVTRLLSLAPLAVLVTTVSACTPDARRALLEQGFDTVQCALANIHLPDDELVVKCAIQTGDLDRIMRIVGEARQASAKAEARGYEAGVRVPGSSEPPCPDSK